MVLKGDVNLDGKVTSTDLVQLKQYLIGEMEFSEQAEKNADINGDGFVTSTDYLQLKNMLVS